MTDTEDKGSSDSMLSGSDEAKRRMALVLEAVAGLRTIQSACAELGIAATQYYALETRMLQAMVDAMEPRKRGRPIDLSAELERQRAANEDLQRELQRVQALHRATQRAVGIREDRASQSAASRRAVSGPKTKTPTTRRRKAPKKTRAQKLCERIDASTTIPASDPNSTPRNAANESGPPEQGS